MLAAGMGGMGFTHSAECEIMRNSALINIHMIHALANASVGATGQEKAPAALCWKAAEAPEGGWAGGLGPRVGWRLPVSR